MTIQKLEKILTNYKFKNKDVKIVVYQRFNDFCLFTLENNLDKDIAGKITNEYIELYGISGDETFIANEEGISSLIKSIEYQLDNGYKLIYYDASKQPLFKLSFISEKRVSEKEAKEVCSKYLNSKDYKYARLSNDSHKVVYNFDCDNITDEKLN